MPQESSRQQRVRDSLAATPVTFQQVQDQLQRTTIERKTINIRPCEVSLGEGESRRHRHRRAEASLVCDHMHKLVKYDSCQRNLPVIVAKLGPQVCPNCLASRKDGQVGMNLDIGVKARKHRSAFLSGQDAAEGLIVDLATIGEGSDEPVTSQNWDIAERPAIIQMLPAKLGHRIANQLGDGTAPRSRCVPKTLVV